MKLAFLEYIEKLRFGFLILYINLDMIVDTFLYKGVKNPKTVAEKTKVQKFLHNVFR